MVPHGLGQRDPSLVPAAGTCVCVLAKADNGRGDVLEELGELDKLDETGKALRGHIGDEGRKTGMLGQ